MSKNSNIGAPATIDVRNMRKAGKAAGKAVASYDLEGNLVETYPRIADATRAMNVNVQVLTWALKKFREGILKEVGGRYWKVVE